MQGDAASGHGGALPQTPILDNFDNFVNFDNFDSGHFPRKYAASGQGGALTQTPILNNFDNFDNVDNFDAGHFPRKYEASGRGEAEGGSHSFTIPGMLVFTRENGHQLHSSIPGMVNTRIRSSGVCGP